MRGNLLVCLATAALLACGRGSQESATEEPGGRTTRVERGLLPAIVLQGESPRKMTLSERMDHYNVPGVSVAVIEGGRIDWAKGYGVLEAGSSEPVTTETLFQAASISKPVAAMAALKMAEDGALTLDGDVNSKLKSWKLEENEFTKKEKVTLRRLLSHSAGLTVRGFRGYAADEAVPTLQQILDGKKPANSEPVRVNREPGVGFRYSGGGYTVVQQLLIDVGRKPFPEIARECVLEPAGMSHSTCEQPLPEILRGTAAVGHLGNGEAVKGRWHTYPEMAAAGLWTSPTDLARFAIEVRESYYGRSNKVLSRQMAREMLTRQEGNFGLGLGISGEGAARRFGHNGANVGYRCEMVMFMESGDGAVVMTNSDRGDALAREILLSIAAEYEWPGYRPARRSVAKLDPGILERYAGRYRFAPEFVVWVEVKAGRLQVQPPGQQVMEMYPESETRFFSLEPGAPLVEFAVDKEGRVTAMRIGGQLAKKID